MFKRNFRILKSDKNNCYYLQEMHFFGYVEGRFVEPSDIYYEWYSREMEMECCKITSMIEVEKLIKKLIKHFRPEKFDQGNFEVVRTIKI